MSDYCVLFDNDGTLVDSEPISARALALSFAELGVILDHEELFYRYRGWRYANMVAEICQPLGLELPDDFEAGFRALMLELFSSELQPVPGAIELLESLRCPVAVVSSGPRPKIRHTLEVAGLAGYFGEHIFSCYELGVWKPEPDIYLHAAATLGFEPASCFAIDDTLIGVEAAVKAGMHTLFLNHWHEDCPFQVVASVPSLAAVAAHLPVSEI